MKSALLAGRMHETLGWIEALAEGPAAISLSRGGASKTYPYTEPNEDAVGFAYCEGGGGGLLVCVADGHSGARGAERAIRYLLERRAPAWTAAEPASRDAEAWCDEGRDALRAVQLDLFEQADELGVAPAPTTLSIAVARPDLDLLLYASAGDSHVLLAGGGEARELGWPGLGRERTYFLGYGDPEGFPDDFMHVGSCSLAGVEAIVLATDGLSEIGIGVADPAAAVAEAVAAARAAEASARPLETARGVAERALAAHGRQAAGDNIATAVVWLGR